MIHTDITNANFNFHPDSLGVIINYIRNGKVKRITLNSSSLSKYVHLRKRERVNSYAVVIAKFDEHVLQQIKSRICERNEDWVVDRVRRNKCFTAKKVFAKQ